MQPKWRLSHARGYLALGLVKEAAAELRAVPAGPDEAPEIMALRVAVLQAQGRWRPLRTIAGRLARLQPEETGWWITWAYATRRALSIAAAEKVLHEAARLHPDEPTIQFNLGCYACLQGDLAAARRHVDRAIALDPQFGELAATDSDLEPLRRPLGEPSAG